LYPEIVPDIKLFMLCTTTTYSPTVYANPVSTVIVKVPELAIVAKEVELVLYLSPLIPDVPLVPFTPLVPDEPSCPLVPEVNPVIANVAPKLSNKFSVSAEAMYVPPVNV
jgi:hypothetical protein